jgi:hypothetical protein
VRDQVREIRREIGFTTPVCVRDPITYAPVVFVRLTVKVAEGAEVAHITSAHMGQLAHLDESQRQMPSPPPV